MVLAMSDEYTDPSGTTDQFKAFAQADTAESGAGLRLPVVVGVAAVALLAVAVVVILAVA